MAVLPVARLCAFIPSPACMTLHWLAGAPVCTPVCLRTAMSRALFAGHAVLEEGCDVMDTAVAAVSCMQGE